MNMTLVHYLVIDDDDAPPSDDDRLVIAMDAETAASPRAPPDSKGQRPPQYARDGDVTMHNRPDTSAIGGYKRVPIETGSDSYDLITSSDSDRLSTNIANGSPEQCVNQCVQPTDYFTSPPFVKTPPFDSFSVDEQSFNNNLGIHSTPRQSLESQNAAVAATIVDLYRTAIVNREQTTHDTPDSTMVLKPFRQRHKKPSYSYAAMCAMAIENADGNRLTMAGIGDAVQQMFSSFKATSAKRLASVRGAIGSQGYFYHESVTGNHTRGRRGRRGRQIFYWRVDLTLIKPTLFLRHKNGAVSGYKPTLHEQLGVPEVRIPPQTGSIDERRLLADIYRAERNLALVQLRKPQLLAKTRHLDATPDTPVTPVAHSAAQGHSAAQRHSVTTVPKMDSDLMLPCGPVPICDMDDFFGIRTDCPDDRASGSLLKHSITGLVSPADTHSGSQLPPDSIITDSSYAETQYGQADRPHSAHHGRKRRAADTDTNVIHKRQRTSDDAFPAISDIGDFSRSSTPAPGLDDYIYTYRHSTSPVSEPRNYSYIPDTQHGLPHTHPMTAPVEDNHSAYRSTGDIQRGMFHTHSTATPIFDNHSAYHSTADAQRGMPHVQHAALPYYPAQFADWYRAAALTSAAYRYGFPPHPAAFLYPSMSCYPPAVPGYSARTYTPVPASVKQDSPAPAVARPRSNTQDTPSQHRPSSQDTPMDTPSPFPHRWYKLPESTPDDAAANFTIGETTTTVI